jgi:hypothetical protein
MSTPTAEETIPPEVNNNIGDIADGKSKIGIEGPPLW